MGTIVGNWSRFAEILLGVWLATSPIVLGVGRDHGALFYVPLACGVIVIATSAASLTAKLRRLHFALLVLALGMIVFALVSPAARTAPMIQNLIVTALLLMIFALVPCRSARPPECWVERETHA